MATIKGLEKKLLDLAGANRQLRARIAHVESDNEELRLGSYDRVTISGERWRNANEERAELHLLKIEVKSLKASRPMNDTEALRELSLVRDRRDRLRAEVDQLKLKNEQLIEALAEVKE